MPPTSKPSQVGLGTRPHDVTIVATPPHAAGLYCALELDEYGRLDRKARTTPTSFDPVKSAASWDEVGSHHTPSLHMSPHTITHTFTHVTTHLHTCHHTPSHMSPHTFTHVTTHLQGVRREGEEGGRGRRERREGEEGGRGGRERREGEDIAAK